MLGNILARLRSIVTPIHEIVHRSVTIPVRVDSRPNLIWMVTGGSRRGIQAVGHLPVEGNSAHGAIYTRIGGAALFDPLYGHSRFQRGQATGRDRSALRQEGGGRTRTTLTITQGAT
ncbi:MAG: hypothetical protein VX500_10615, partial [Planctomycetota bacterium]|nr:hypothetical protein [Planctomycetota bacterium]